MANSYLSDDGVTTLISLTKNELKKKASSTELLGALCAQGEFFVGDKGYKVDNALFAQNEGVVNPDTGKTIVTLSPLFATKTELNDAIGGVTSIKAEVVTALPATGVNGTIYLVAHAHGTGDAYDEYLWIESAKKFEKIGNTDIDLSSYAKKTDLNSYLTTANASTTYAKKTDLNSYVAKADLTEITSTKVTELWNSIS